MSVNGKALTAATIGGLLVWSGVKGFSVLGTLNDILSGNMPSQAELYPLGSSTGDTSGEASAGRAPLAETAVQYVGHPYRFGGAPGINAQNPWDCSSMVNYVVGVKLGRAIPGYKAGTYKGTSHGPSTPQWAVWNGYATKVDRARIQSGDIIVWVGAGYGHMGIAVDNERYVSALNPKSTTRIQSIDGFGHNPTTVGRL